MKTASLFKQIVPEVKLPVPIKWAKKPSKRYRALAIGDSAMWRKAAEILDALDAGVPLESIEIPPGVTIEPTVEQIGDTCREIGVEPPA